MDSEWFGSSQITENKRVIFESDGMRLKAFRCYLVVFYIGLSFVIPSRGGDWPNWLGPERNGVSRELLPDEVQIGDLLWEAEIGIGFSSISISRGSLYAIGHRDGQETAWKLCAETGSVEASFSYPAELLPKLHEGGPAATPSVAKEQVILMSKDGQLRVLTKDLSQVFWEKSMMEESELQRIPEWGFAASPVIVGDLVLVEAGATFAYDLKTGKERWRSKFYRPAYGTPHVFQLDGKRFVAVLKTDGLVILCAETGETLGFSLWRTSFQTNSTTPLEIGEGKFFISTGYDRGCCLFVFNGENLSTNYENMNMCNHMGNSVLMKGALYGFDGTAHRGREVEFTCLDPVSGEKQWHFEGLGYGSVIGVGDDLIVLTEVGELLIGAAATDGFVSRAKKQVLDGRCWTPPVFANGILYARNAEGRLVAQRLGQ